MEKTSSQLDWASLGVQRLLAVYAPELVSETADNDNDFLLPAMQPVYGFRRGGFPWLDWFRFTIACGLRASTACQRLRRLFVL